MVSFAEPYATFITQGKTWRIVEVREDELLVEQIREIGSIPSWVGEDIPVPVRRGPGGGPAAAGRRTIPTTTGTGTPVKASPEYFEEQRKDGAMPTDKLVTLEIGKAHGHPQHVLRDQGQ